MHLPKLTEAGYIAWDADTHTIQRGLNFDENTLLLRLMTDHEDKLPWDGRNPMSRPLRTLLSRFGGPTQAETPPSRDDSRRKSPTALFSCPACERTDISEAMDACSKYGESVTQIPTERELPLSTSRA